MSSSEVYATGDVLAEAYFTEGLRWLVLRGPIGTPVAYMGIPVDSPAAGLSYDHLDAVAPSVHGGWTFSGAGDGKYRPMGWWWWGWDYAHAWDATPYSPEGHAWTTAEVVAEIRELLPQFEAWLRSRPEATAGQDARRPPATLAELRTMAERLEQLLGGGCLDVP